MDQTVLSCRKLAKTFTQGKISVNVFSDIDLDVIKGERIAIVVFCGQLSFYRGPQSTQAAEGVIHG